MALRVERTVTYKWDDRDDVSVAITFDRSVDLGPDKLAELDRLAKTFEDDVAGVLLTVK